MTGKLRKVSKLVLCLCVVVGMAGGIWDYVMKQKGDAIYTDAQALAGVALPEEVPASAPAEKFPQIPLAPEDEEPVLLAPEVEAEEDPIAQALLETDLEALQEVNPDVLGWITIPDTVISYPVVQGTDNSHYLSWTWNGSHNGVGSIFLDSQVAADFSDFSTIIYGHRMNNGSMFGGLKYYQTQEYWQKHPSVYIVTEAGVARYDVYAAYEAKVDTITFGLGISSRPKKQEFIDHGLAQSRIDTGVVPSTLDSIITLSTCTGNGYTARWVVQAVLRAEYPAAGHAPGGNASLDAGGNQSAS